MKLYVVIASSGSWDSYSEWIHSIHLTEEVAEEFKNKINAEWENKKGIPPPPFLYTKTEI